MLYKFNFYIIIYFDILGFSKDFCNIQVNMKLKVGII